VRTVDIHPSRAPLLIAAGGGAIIVASVVAAAVGQPLPVYALTALLVVVVLRTRDWMPFGLLLIVLCSIFYMFPTTDILGYRVTLPDVLVPVALLAVATRRPPRMEAAGWLLLLFILAVAGGIAIGARQVGTAAFADARPLVAFAAFWAALQAARQPRAVALIAVLLTGLVLIVQFGELAGYSLLYKSATSNAVEIQTDFGGLVRVRTPGLTLAYATGLFALSYLLWGPRERRAIAGVIVAMSGLAVALSLNRNMVVGALLGLGTALFVDKLKARTLALAGTVVVVALCVLFALAPAGGRPADVAQRFLSAFSGTTLQSKSIESRVEETRVAWKAIAAHPMSGIGFGTSYGMTWNGAVRTWLHNQWLWVWLRAGLLGVTALAAAFVVTFGRGVRWLRSGLPTRWLGGAVVVATVALASGSTVAMYLSERDSIVVVVGIMAVAAGHRMSQRPSVPPSGRAAGGSLRTAIRGSRSTRPSRGTRTDGGQRRVTRRDDDLTLAE